jgi:hypothetical protein
VAAVATAATPAFASASSASSLGGAGRAGHAAFVQTDNTAGNRVVAYDRTAASSAWSLPAWTSAVQAATSPKMAVRSRS